MSQSLAKILVHTVFSTKERRPFLRDRTIREEMHRYLGGILNNLGCQSVIVGGVDDHVHLLALLARTCGAADMVKEVKRGSSLWIKERDALLVGFRVAEWLRYFLSWFFSVGKRERLHCWTGAASPQADVSR